jgi:hypothetical protein
MPKMKAEFWAEDLMKPQIKAHKKVNKILKDASDKTQAFTTLIEHEAINGEKT